MEEEDGTLGHRETADSPLELENAWGEMTASGLQPAASHGSSRPSG
jgi:hypothetical protein